MRPLNIIVFACIIFLATVWILQFSQSDGWDIFHFMYSGQRLLEGELNWSVEYFDKLLIAQIIFALPALFGSIKVWYLFSAFFALLGAWACRILVQDVLSDYPNISTKDRKVASNLAAVSVIYLFSVLPGGLMHVNVTSASMAVLAIALFVRLSFVSSKSRFMSLALFFLSTLSASISIGIRPYFLFSLVTTIIFFSARSNKAWFGHKGILIESGLWVFTVGVFGLLINMVPYILIGDINAFKAGMSLLSQVLNPGNFVSIIYNIILDIGKQKAFTLFLIILSFSSSILALIKLFFSRDKSSDSNQVLVIIMLTLISPFLILIMIFSRHYWSHYLQFFAPFWGLGIGFFFIFYKISFNFEKLMSIYMKWSLVISLCLFTILPPLMKNIREVQETIFNKRALNVGEIRVREILDILSTQPESKRDFLFIDDMRPHFILNEYRHGFPQAAITRHIVKYEYWTNIDMPKHFGYPTNAEEYCTLLEKMGPSIIFISIKINDFESSCLNKSSFYQFTEKLPTNVSLYLRN